MKSLLAVLVLVVLSSRLFVLAQEPASDSTSASASAVSGVPRLIRFSGVVKGPEMNASTVLGITFFLYKDQQGGAPLWMETQNVQPDANGRYSVQLGSTQTTGVPVDLFSSGEARWLGVQVQGKAEQPRVLLLSVPYALKAADAETLGGKPLSAFQLALPQAKNSTNASTGNSQNAQAATEQPNEISCTGTTGCKAGFIPRFSTNGGSATVSNSIISQSGTNINVAGNFNARDIVTATDIDASRLVQANNMVDDAVAIIGNSPGGGVFGGAGSFSGLSGGLPAGVWGDSSGGFGVLGTSGSYFGVEGSSQSNYGVFGSSRSQIGVAGETYGAAGVSAGVYGFAHGDSIALVGVNAPTGSPSINNATLALANRSPVPEFVIYAANGDASKFVRTDNLGDLLATGSITGASKPFKIDHPLDPANKYLMHTAIESPDMKTIYDGMAGLDGNGEAWIELPTYFEALNQDFRYQLTAIGASQPGLYIAEEIAANRFRVAGGKPGAKVSWQVTGIHHDAWANAHRTPVEIEKTGAERGRYLHPDVFGLGPEQSVSYNGGTTRLELPEIGRKRPNEMHPVTPLGKP
jgi:hypothetical protein